MASELTTGKKQATLSGDRMKHACQHRKLRYFTLISPNPFFSLVMKDTFVNQICGALLTLPSLGTDPAGDALRARRGLVGDGRAAL